MKPEERRQAIIELLCQQRQMTMKELASKFGVSIRTIYYDIEILSLAYPLVTMQGKHGGVYVMEGFHLRKRYLSPVQQAFLEQLAHTLDGEDLDIMLSILRDFVNTPPPDGHLNRPSQTP